MFQQHESVELTREVGGIAAGTLGAIVHVHVEGGPYEVEFFNDAGETIDVVTVEAADLRPYDRTAAVGPTAGVLTVADLIALLQQIDPSAPVLTSGYEGGLVPARVSSLEVQKLDRHGEKDWLGDWERVDEAREQAAEPDGPSALNPIDGYRSPTMVGGSVTAAVIYRAGR